MLGCEQGCSLYQIIVIISFIKVISLSFWLLSFILQGGLLSGSALLPHVMLQNSKHALGSDYSVENELQ